MRVEVKKVNPGKPSVQLLRRAARLIRKGAVIVCPTDTGYALAANALDAKAIVKVFNLKGRAYSNPIHIAVNSLEMAGRYAHVIPEAEQLAHSFLPGALTLVLTRKEGIPSLLVAGRDTVGIRIPDNRVILDLTAIADLPITATSANASGQPTPYSVPEVMKLLGEAVEQVSLILDQGAIPSRGLSTIVDLTVSPPQLLRQGLVSWLEIRQVLRAIQDPGSGQK
ncbi:MAG TPA: threonylcarbamoyl-AMP synthase [Dehalococcoidia bacterium]|nr:threonylcarbamoyl-AMP synthase [Dehalococcoidia bacterium]